MKRSALLSVILLSGLFLAAGYQGSSVIKEAPKYEVSIQALDNSNDFFTFASTSVVAETPEAFVLFVPELGEPKSVESVQVAGKLENGYDFSIRPPPRWCQNS